MPVTDTIPSGYFWHQVSTRETLTSTKWNNHFGLFRGHLLPIDGSLSAAANNSYDLGSSTYRWRTLYVGSIDISNPTESVTPAITAFAGGGQASATTLTSQNNIVTVCATDSDSVKLPTATAGKMVRIMNYQNSKELAVFPVSTESINGITNTSYAIRPRKFMEFFCHTSGAWIPLGTNTYQAVVSSETTFSSDATWTHPAGNSMQLNPGNYLIIYGSKIRRVDSATPGIIQMLSGICNTSTGASLNTSQISLKSTYYNDEVAAWGINNGFVQTDIDNWGFGGIYHASVISTTTIYGVVYLDLSTAASITKFVCGIKMTAIRTSNDI